MVSSPTDVTMILFNCLIFLYCGKYIKFDDFGRFSPPYIHSCENNNVTLLTMEVCTQYFEQNLIHCSNSIQLKPLAQCQSTFKIWVLFH